MHAAPVGELGVSRDVHATARYGMGKRPRREIPKRQHRRVKIKSFGKVLELSADGSSQECRRSASLLCATRLVVEFTLGGKFFAILIHDRHFEIRCNQLNPSESSLHFCYLNLFFEPLAPDLCSLESYPIG